MLPSNFFLIKLQYNKELSHSYTLLKKYQSNPSHLEDLVNIQNISTFLLVIINKNMQQRRQKKTQIDDSQQMAHNSTINSQSINLIKVSNTDFANISFEDSKHELNQLNSGDRQNEKKHVKRFVDLQEKNDLNRYEQMIDHHLDEANQMKKNSYFARNGAESPQFRNQYEASFKPQLQIKEKEAPAKKRKSRNIESLKDKTARQAQQSGQSNPFQFMPQLNMQIVQIVQTSLNPHESKGRRSKQSKEKSTVPSNNPSLKHIVETDQDQMINNSFRAIKSPFEVFSFQRQHKCFLNRLNPIYSLDLNNTSYTIQSKKILSCFSSQYKISLSQKGNLESNPKVLAKLVSNCTGSEFNLFKTNQYGIQQLIATIIFNIECRFSSLRKMQVYIKNQSKSYEQLRGNLKQGSNLKTIYESKDAQVGCMRKLITKQPKWRQDLQCYIQNFKKKSKIPSSKNIILVEQSNPIKDCLLFCKRNVNEFYGEMSSPLCPIITMGILLSMFDFKWLIQ